MAGADDMRRARSTKAEPGFVKRRNRLNEGFSIRPIGMLASPAYRALSLSAFRVIGRIELELCSHGGNDNGQLPVTCEDFEKYGISHNQIAPAIREAEALGFIRVTEHGRGGNAEYRRPNKFYLTFPMHRGGAPTNEWQKIKSEEEATQLARAARENKNSQAVRLGQQRAKKTKNRPWNPVAKPKTLRPLFPVVQRHPANRDYYLYLGQGPGFVPHRSLLVRTSLALAHFLLN
jgi:hypothetical protein